MSASNESETSLAVENERLLTENLEKGEEIKKVSAFSNFIILLHLSATFSRGQCVTIYTFM